MNSLIEINREYEKLVMSNLRENVKTAQKALEYIMNSTAKYHGRCVKTLYIPKLFTKKEVQLFESLINELYQIFDKVFEHYRNDAAYRKLFGFSKELEELILREPLYLCNIPISRIDIFLNEETHEFKFCEFNTDGSSAMNEDRELNIAVKYTKAYRQFEKKYKLTSFDLFTTWVEEVKNIYGTYQKKKDKPYLAIVDFMESATENEFAVFTESFINAGIPAEICEIRELKYKNGRLYTPSGNIIDIVYRRAVTGDIMSHYEEVSDFIRAVEEDAVCLIGEFRTQIAHNKVLFKILHMEETSAFLSEKEKEYIKCHVPYTADLKDGNFNYEHVIAHKDQWIIKPEDFYGSKGVYAGVEYDDSQWKQLIDQNKNTKYLLQEFCVPYKTRNLDLMTKPDAEITEYSNLTGLYVYNGKFSGVYSRVSSCEIISTQYSEIALATCVMEEG